MAHLYLFVSLGQYAQHQVHDTIITKWTAVIIIIDLHKGIPSCFGPKDPHIHTIQDQHAVYSQIQTTEESPKIKKQLSQSNHHCLQTKPINN